MSAHYLIRLVEEQGAVLAEVQDFAGFVDDVLAPHAAKFQGLARHIDPYGRTSFNGMQCKGLMVELELLQNSNLMSVHGTLPQQLMELLRRAATQIHLHVVFLGD